MCRVLKVQRSGFYAWRVQPRSERALADEALFIEISQFFEASHGIYGSPRIHRLSLHSWTEPDVDTLAAMRHDVFLRPLYSFVGPNSAATFGEAEE